MKKQFFSHLASQLQDLKTNGLYKEERVIVTPQQAEIKVEPGGAVLNFCANNYLGLADHPELVKAAERAASEYGFGMSSVRFICGTLDIHKKLEKRLSHFLGFDDAILYSSCFDANGGLFDTFFPEEDAVISDALNHASIIDGIRLCKAKRLRYQNSDMADLERQLKEAEGSRFRLIATDGVFSMDGHIANLPAICDLADKYDALVMVDDSHAVGFVGKNGKGTHEHCGVMDRIDIMTGTLGKALGGASGGYTVGRREIVEWLRQRSRPYLFSNTLAPIITAVSIKVLDLLESSTDLRKRLFENARYFRGALEKLGFNLIPGEHPIIPLMLGDAKLSKEFAARMLEEGIYVISFSYPVVPKDKARIRTQISAAHKREHLDRAILAFEKVGKRLGVIQ